MGTRYLMISAASTALSFVALLVWTDFSLDKLKIIFSEDFVHLESIDRAIELVLGSYATYTLLGNFVLNAFVLLILCLKTIFFIKLYPSETRKFVERLINYVIYKGTFLPLVVPPTVFQAGLWSTWLTVLCSLKMFQALARDRLERLNASPSATPWTYFRVFSALLLVLSVDCFWLRSCLVIYRTMGSSMLLLLFFEPLSVALRPCRPFWFMVSNYLIYGSTTQQGTAQTAKCQNFLIYQLQVHCWNGKAFLFGT
ncbi:hypothetical protein LWI28_011584 [Acer negundo]|uniref:E3 ubiquitin-protein ligase synoviolin-like TPR repeats domain-containing protein n=1 Tax=Acer negundo TaxID=4023 RepID=A0AAD5IDM5_ACENE|nr:hypothetical protein LWI28_011584 [Acer negundo]